MTNSSPTTATIIGELRALMARRRVTQGQLADVLGCSAQSVTRRMKGDKSFTIDELDTIAAYLLVVQNLLGHSSPTTTAVYTAWSRPAAEDAVGGLALPA
jgi:transcriptional regulator with XRE-family HTH domain